MPEQPKKQNYEGLEKSSSNTVDVSFLCLKKGTFVHIDANGQAVEVRMDDDGRVGVCVSVGVAVATFAEIYGA